MKRPGSSIPLRPTGSLRPFGPGIPALRRPCPPHYRTAFASSDVPNPHLHRLALRLAFPCGRDTGFPRFASEVCGVRYLLSTGKRVDHEMATLNPSTCLRAFWLKLVSHFSLCALTVVAQVHMCLPYPLPSHRPACGCQESRSLAVPTPHARACLCTLSGPLFIQAPRFTRWYGWSSINEATMRTTS